METDIYIYIYIYIYISSGWMAFLTQGQAYPFKALLSYLSQQLRREGVRLFMLWFQALQDNSDELCQLIYACLIPGFPNPVDSLDWSKNKLSKACAEEIYLSIGDMASRDLLSSTSNMHLLSADGESEGQLKKCIIDLQNIFKDLYTFVRKTLLIMVI